MLRNWQGFRRQTTKCWGRDCSKDEEEGSKEKPRQYLFNNLRAKSTPFTNPYSIHFSSEDHNILLTFPRPINFVLLFTVHMHFIFRLQRIKATLSSQTESHMFHFSKQSGPLSDKWFVLFGLRLARGPKRN